MHLFPAVKSGMTVEDPRDHSPCRKVAAIEDLTTRHHPIQPIPHSPHQKMTFYPEMHQRKSHPSYIVGPRGIQPMRSCAFWAQGYQRLPSWLADDITGW